MILVCYNAFGNKVPGDEVEVPDGSEYDAAYFKEKAAEPPAPQVPAQEGESQ